MNLLFLARLVGPVVLFVSWPFAAMEFASGWNDFRVRIEDRYDLVRSNSTEVYITYRGKPQVPRLPGKGKQSVGPLYGLYWNEHCFLVRHHGYIHIAGMADRISSYTFTLSRATRRFRGPLEGNQLVNAAHACGVRGEIPWMSVREAYIWSLKTYPDQRWNRPFIKVKLTGTFWQGLLLLVVLLPLFVGLAVLFYAIDRFVLDRAGRRRWNVWPLFIPGWPLAAVLISVLSFLNETVLLLI